jgi:hypothetical protein
MPTRRTRQSPVVEISFNKHALTTEQSAQLAKSLAKDALSPESLDALAVAVGWITASLNQRQGWPTAKQIEAAVKRVRDRAGALSQTLIEMLESSDPIASIVRPALRREFGALAVMLPRLDDLVGELDRLRHAAAQVPGKSLAPPRGGRDKQYGDLAYLLSALADVFKREKGEMPTAYHREVTGTVEGTFMPFALPASKLLAPTLQRPATDAQVGELAITVLDAKRAENLGKSKGEK